MFRPICGHPQRGEIQRTDTLTSYIDVTVVLAGYAPQ